MLLVFIVICVISFISGWVSVSMLHGKKEKPLAPHVGELHVIVDKAYPDPQLYLQLDIDPQKLIGYDRREVQVKVHTNARNASTNME